MSYRLRTRQEVKQRLVKYLKSEKDLVDPKYDDIKKQIAQEILDYIDQNKLVSDEEFAKLLIDSKTKGKSVLGKRAILAKLTQKGISKSDAGMFIDTTVSAQDELATAVKALINRYKISAFAGPAPSPSLEPQLYDTYKMRGNMANYLATRGFSYDIAKQAVDYLLKRP